MTVMQFYLGTARAFVGHGAIALSLALISAVVVGTETPNVAVGAVIFLLACAMTCFFGDIRSTEYHGVH